MTRKDCRRNYKGVGVDRLSKFNYYMVTALLNQAGFLFEQEIGSEMETWYNPIVNRRFMITRTSNNLSKESLLDILNQAGLSKEEFLNI